MGTFLNQPSMAAGEIGPQLYGRVDQELYYIGMRSMLNFYVQKFGGAANRPGTKFTTEVQNFTKKVRLIPFVFNEQQTYALEFGNQYMRVIKDGAQVLETAVNITGATQANPVVVTTSGSHGYSDGDQVYISTVEGMEELNGRNFVVANKTATTFELTDYLGNNIDGTGYTAYSSAGTVAKIYEISTPWVEADLFELNYAQSNDVLTISHNDYPLRDITRTADDAWTLSQFTNVEGPFKDTNITSTTVYADATTGSGVTLTASSGIFDSSMVGELFYLQQEPDDSTERWEVSKAITANDIRRAGSHYYKAANSATTGTYRPDHIEGTQYDGDGAVQWEYLHSGFGVVEITGYSSATSVTVTVKKTLPDLVVGSGNATTIWAKAAWSDAEGYPAAVAYQKQRFWAAGTANQPSTLWISGVAARTFFGKSSPILDDDSINLTLDSTTSNAMRHLLPLRSMIALTSSNEQFISGPDGLILATDPPAPDPDSYNGSSLVHPLIIGNRALYVQDMGSVVRDLSYDNETGISGIDLTARSPHLFLNKQIVDWAYHREPHSVIWCVMSTGELYAFTYMEEQRVYAWTRIETDGEFESVCSIREGNESATYFAVKREIDGNTVRYIERLNSRYFQNVREAYFVDSGLSYDGRNYSLTTKGKKVASTAVTMTLTGGTTWDEPENLTLTASSATFESDDVGDEIVFWYKIDANGDYVDWNTDISYKEEDKLKQIAVRLTISAYTSSTIVTVIPKKTVPSAYRSTAFTDWEFARDVFQPLWHIEGEAVSILADGNVVEGKTVADGKITLDNPAAVVHIGLPYTCDLETLDMAQPQGQTKAKSLNVPRVFLTVHESRSVFVGINGFNDLEEIKQREVSIGYDSPIPAETKVFEVETSSDWSNRGRIAIRQTRPLPITISSITPDIQGGYS